MEKLTRYCIEDFTELIYYNSNMVHKRRLRSLLGRIRHQRDYDVHIIEAIPILEHLLEKPFYLKEEDNHEFYVIYDPSLKEDLEIEESESYIYFILSDDGYVKIGLSNDPEKRLKSLQTATAHELKIIHQIPGLAIGKPIPERNLEILDQLLKDVPHDGEDHVVEIRVRWEGYHVILRNKGLKIDGEDVGEIG